MVNQNVCLAQLCRQIIITWLYQRVLNQRALRVITFFRNTAQVQVCRVDMTVAVDQFLQIAFGFVPGLKLKAHQRQRETQFIVFRVLLNQAGELHFCLIDAVLLDQRTCIGQAQSFVVRVVAHRFLQQRQGFVATVKALQQAGAQQNRGYFTVLRRMLLQQFQGAGRVIVLLHQQGFAEDQLIVVRVSDQQEIKVFLQACTGVGVCFEGRQG